MFFGDDFKDKHHPIWCILRSQQLHLYRMGPIDFIYEYWPTINISDKGLDYLSKCLKSFGWEGDGDFRFGFSLDKQGEEFWFIFVKQSNNGTCFLASDDQIDMKTGEYQTVPGFGINLESKEGKVKYSLHKTRERDKSLVKAKKSSSDGQCECCGFNFERVYGPLGMDYIECHHRTPLAMLEEDSVTTLDDLALVCANCHRMLHRRSGCVSVEKLRSIVCETVFGHRESSFGGGLDAESHFLTKELLEDAFGDQDFQS